jgi:hypothetical protein
METLYGILGIIFGWLLGLLTPPISARIDRSYRKKDHKLAINSELKNLEVRLAFLIFNIRSHLGILDKPTLEGIRDIYKKFGFLSIPPEMEKVFELSDDDFKTVMNTKKASANSSLGIKTFSLPVIDALLGDISIFDTDFQRKLLELRSQIDILNQEIEYCMQYFFLTFDPTSMATNSNTLNTNIENSHKQIANRCKIVIEKIEEILEK